MSYAALRGWRLKSSTVILLIGLVFLTAIHISFRPSLVINNNRNDHFGENFNHVSINTGNKKMELRLKPGGAQDRKISIFVKYHKSEQEVIPTPGIQTDQNGKIDVESKSQNSNQIGKSKIENRNSNKVGTASRNGNSIKISKYEEILQREPDFNEKLQIFNQLGMKQIEKRANGHNTYNFRDDKSHYVNNFLDGLNKIMRKKFKAIQGKRRMAAVSNAQELKLNPFAERNRSKVKITVAAIACGQQSDQLMILLKSAVLFSQDAELHFIVFVDQDSIMNVGLSLLEIKWITEALALSFSFEIHPEWFPQINGVNWKDMYAKCATQRLFFPMLLPHVDSVIYLDLDTIIISNLTELWLHIPNKMKENKLAALAANNEDRAASWYDGNEVPHYGPKGLNAGVMLMNLTQMRTFHFEDKSIGAHALYHEHIKLADQDIINIIFSAFPEKLLELDCSYNFNWVHCGGELLGCANNGTVENICFCRSAIRDGVKIVHGNGGTFQSTYAHHLFLPEMHSAFEKLNLLTDSYVEIIMNLKRSFTKLIPRPCFPLSADLLYGNAETYLKNLNHNSF